MVNSVFGKFGEDLANRKNVRFANKHEDVLKYSSHPLLESYEVIGETLVKFHLHKETVTMIRPIAIAVAILDLAKVFFFKKYVYFKNIFFVKKTKIEHLTGDYVRVLLSGIEATVGI